LQLSSTNVPRVREIRTILLRRQAQSALPGSCATQTGVFQELNMKSRSESVSTSKGNVSAKGSNDGPREQMIAEAAYFYAERRDFAPENELDDWLRAEADVNDRISSGQ
jgi:hypothetical protein